MPSFSLINYDRLLIGLQTAAVCEEGGSVGKMYIIQQE